jgi:hypothetical protein
MDSRGKELVLNALPNIVKLEWDQYELGSTAERKLSKA